MNNKLSDDFNDIAANLHAAQCRIGELVNEISGLRARLAEYERAAREPVPLQTPLAWIHEDELPDGYPYDALFPYSMVDVVRMFPIYGPQTDVMVADELYKIANHIASAKNGLPQEWQDWAEEIETDIRRAYMLINQQPAAPVPDEKPDAKDLEFQIDLLENFESEGEENNTQLICWLKELQRRRAAMLPSAKSPAIPDGYRLCLVPLEHTEAFHAACSAAFEEFNAGTGPCGVFIAGHRAMLAASPSTSYQGGKYNGN